jgi:hypothetical protein
MDRNYFIARRLCPLAVLSTALLALGCDDKPKPSPHPTTSASVTAPVVASTGKPLPPLSVKTFKGLGLTFEYPEPYVPETATSNPEIHQVALDHNREPGVLTVRFNPKDPGADINLDEVAEASRLRMGPEATVAPAKLEVAGKSYEARSVKANQLGLVGTIDVMAVVRMGETNYVVTTHVSNDDQKRAQRLFDIVLKSLAQAK